MQSVIAGAEASSVVVGGPDPSPVAVAPRAGGGAVVATPTDDLRGRSVRGAAATLAGQGVRFGLQIVSTVVLARLLTPRDYGLVAMVTVVTGFIGTFKDLGLSQAAVQRKQITHEQVTALFWVNVAVSVVLAGVVAAVAPALAWLYGEPALTPVTLALSVGFIFGGLSAQHAAMLRRQMRFAAIATRESASFAVGLAAAITAAWLGAGYWALVVLNLVMPLTAMVLLWVLSDFRPGPPRRCPGTLGMIKFGANLAGFNVVNYLSRHTDGLLIGWYHGAGPLGLYSRAYQILLLPVQQLVGPFSRVVPSVLCRLQDQPERYRQYYKRALRPLLAVGFPLVAFTAVEADRVVGLLLGPKWSAVADVFRWLAPASWVGVSFVATGWVYGSLGRTDRQLRWGLVSSAVTVAAFAVAVPFGIEAVAIAYSAVTVALRFPGVWYCFKGTPLTPADLTAVGWRPTVAALAAAGIVLAARQFEPAWPAALGLTVNGLVYGVLYLAVWALLPKGRAELAEMLGYVRELRAAKKDRAARRPAPVPVGAATGGEVADAR